MRTESKSTSDKWLLWQLKALTLSIVICIAFNCVEQYVQCLQVEATELAKDAPGENQPFEAELNIELESDDYFHPDLIFGLDASGSSIQARIHKINSYLEQFKEINTPPPEHII